MLASRYIKSLHHNIFRKSRTKKRVILRFAENIGLVCFGNIESQDEETSVRGFTSSTTHQDNHYCVGSLDDYDISIVDRTDVIYSPKDSDVLCNWLIMSFKLNTKQDVPDMFIHSKGREDNHYRPFFETSPTFKEVEFGTFEDYDKEFLNRFSIYAKPTDFIEIERIFPNLSTKVLSAHFWPFSAEIKDGVVYIYADNLQVTFSLLSSMLENGLWLAKHLDSQIELV